jgi:hypothetical protein
MKLSAADLDVLCALLVKRLDSRGRELPADLVLRPFFESREGANLIFRLLPQDWKRKWNFHFRMYGCVKCERGPSEVEYGSAGFCVPCKGVVIARLRSILDEMARDPGWQPVEFPAKMRRKLVRKARA